MAFTLQGRRRRTKRAFMRNPTSCKPAMSTIVATPYGTPATPVTKTSSFTPTDARAAVRAAHRGHGRRQRRDRASGQAAGAHDHHAGRRAGRPVVRDRRAAADPRRRPHPARARLPGRAGRVARSARTRRGSAGRGGDAAARAAAHRHRLPGLARARRRCRAHHPARRPDPAAARGLGRADARRAEDDVHRPARRAALALPARPRGRRAGRVPARLGPVRRSPRRR